jgi:hypothetical protein
MPRAGIAHFTVRETAYKGKAWEYKLQFNTTGMFDKVYRMRDTLTTYFTEDNRVIFSDKRTEEGGYYLVDQLTFTGGTAGAASGRAAGNAGSSASVHSFRYARSGVKIDTTLVVEGCLYDMMAATMYLRSIDWAGLRVKDEYPFRVIVGRDVVNVSYRYTGQAVVSPDEKTRYRTHHFYIDVYDPAFEQSKEAAEVWVGDDANHLPIRVRAKLKIGAVEVYIKTAATLKHPFTSKISIADAFYR